MHFIIELDSQLQQVPITERCFINLIPVNDNKHPILTTPSLLYLHPENTKGYIIVLDHSEGFSLDLKRVIEVLSKYKRIYCLDSKYHSYFIDLPLIDINYQLLEASEKPMEIKGDTPLINQFYQRCSKDYEGVNKLIPISKLYEFWEEKYDKIKDYLGRESNLEFYEKFDKVYKEVEKEGLKINTKCFGEFFTPHSIGDFFDRGKVYTRYNLYNTTCRPTNAFNGINFLALNKENHSRKCFVPENNYFVEFDFDGYHIRLIANLIGYELPSGSIHTYFGQQYFKKEVLTEEEYAQSKQITFQNIYGGISEEWQEVPFFKALIEYLDNLQGDSVQLPTGKVLKTDEYKNPLTLFNYVIQNLETKTNVELISEILYMLRNKKSKVKLIVYDSFLIDFSIEDGKDTLINITKFLNSKNYPVKVKYGKDYDSLIKTSYL